MVLFLLANSGSLGQDAVMMERGYGGLQLVICLLCVRAAFFCFFVCLRFDVTKLPMPLKLVAWHGVMKSVTEQ
jgi:hypothetical protein